MGDAHAWVGFVLAHGERRRRWIHHRIRLDVFATLGTGAEAHRLDSRRDRAELLAHLTAQRLSVRERERQSGDHIRAAIDQVTLPAGPDHGVALAHEEPMAGTR